MATTRIIAMHRNKGCTVEQALKARLDYIKNPEKTREGELVWRLVKPDDGSMAEPDIELFHSAHSAVCEYAREECNGLSADY